MEAKTCHPAASSAPKAAFRAYPVPPAAPAPGKSGTPMTLTQFSKAFSNTGISCLRHPFCGPYTAVAPRGPSSGLVTSVATVMRVWRRWGQMSSTERSEAVSMPLMKVGMSLFRKGLEFEKDHPRAESRPKPPSLVPLPPIAMSISLTPWLPMHSRRTMPRP